MVNTKKIHHRSPARELSDQQNGTVIGGSRAFLSRHNLKQSTIEVKNKHENDNSNLEYKKYASDMIVERLMIRFLPARGRQTSGLMIISH